MGDKMILFSGTCAVESYEICSEVATEMKRICNKLGIDYVFKASFDKANRTSSNSFRGIENSLKVLERVKHEIDVPIITDVHETWQCQQVIEIADYIQIPAFLCRQTDLIKAAARSGKPVNIKKGQFMAPDDMQYAVLKVKEEGNDSVYLTERGTSFGYNNLVVDFRSIPIMQKFAPVIFDVTHSLQQPGGMTTGGQRQYAGYLARAAAAVGVDGFFIETHPDPSKAMSDKETMLPLRYMEEFLKMILAFKYTKQ